MPVMYQCIPLPSQEGLFRKLVAFIQINPPVCRKQILQAVRYFFTSMIKFQF
ncbi:MAG: hypothetical protein JEY99_07225 [Spirochaetales bacterium]|nr:hypothetical protein [Spirochaetales bacterium]